MFTVLLCMFAGIAVGWLLRNRDCGWASKTVTVLLWALLFLLGVEVGGDKKILSALPSPGLDALAIAVLPTVRTSLLPLVPWHYTPSFQTQS